jgi:hypothetical protein
MVMAKEKEMAKGMLVVALRAFEPTSNAQQAEVRSRAPKGKAQLRKAIFHFSFYIRHFSFETIDLQK